MPKTARTQRRLAVTLHSLSQELARVDAQKLDLTAMLANNSYTTGICLGHAVATILHVESHKEKAVIPPLLNPAPTSEIQYYELLLPLAVLQSLKQTDSYNDASFAPKNRRLLSRAFKSTVSLLQQETGYSIDAMYPKPSRQSGNNLHSATALTETNVNALIDDIAEYTDTPCVLLFRTKTSTLPDTHVVYVHFGLGIISDGAAGVMWKCPHLSVFSAAVKHYVNKIYAKKEAAYTHVSALVLKKGEIPDQLPLPIRFSHLYAKLMYHISKREGIKSGLLFGSYLAWAVLPFTLKNKIPINYFKEQANRVSNFIKDQGENISLITSTARMQQALWEACNYSDSFGNLEPSEKRVKKLLALKANPNLPHVEIFPLSQAVARGNMRVIKALLQEGAKADLGFQGIKQKNLDSFYGGMSPLTTAIGHSPRSVTMKVVTMLLRRGARPCMMDLDIAVEQRWDVAMLLINKYKCVPTAIHLRNVCGSMIGRDYYLEEPYPLLDLILKHSVDVTPAVLECLKGLKTFHNKNSLYWVGELLERLLKPGICHTIATEIEQTLSHIMASAKKHHLTDEHLELYGIIAKELLSYGADADLIATFRERLKEAASEQTESSAMALKVGL